MKKLLAMMLMLLPMIAWGQGSSDAQKITKEVSVNGSNLVESLFCKVEAPASKVYAGLTPQIYYKDKQPITYGLSLQIPDCWVHIEEGAPIIIKLKDGSIVEGKALVDAKHDAYDHRDLGSEYYYKFSIIWYGFNKEDMTKMREVGIVKLRASDGVKFYDYQITEEASAKMNNGFDFLENYIQNKPTLYDNF